MDFELISSKLYYTQNAFHVLAVFRSVWNIIDVVVIVVCVLAIGSDVWKIATHVHDRSMLRQVIDVLRLLRAVRLLQIFRIFFEDAIHILDKVHDTGLALSFELGKCYIAGEKEILDMLPYMIDNTKIRNEMKQKIEENQLVLQQLLGMVQKDRSWIAITVKTTQAIRMVLNGMKESINQLKSTGRLYMCRPMRFHYHCQNRLGGHVRIREVGRVVE